MQVSRDWVTGDLTLEHISCQMKGAVEGQSHPAGKDKGLSQQRGADQPLPPSALASSLWVPAWKKYGHCSHVQSASKLQQELAVCRLGISTAME